MTAPAFRPHCRQPRLQELRRRRGRDASPGLLSFLANGDFTTEVKGVNQLVPSTRRTVRHQPAGRPRLRASAPGRKSATCPVMEVTYWGFRMMIGFGGIAALAALLACGLTRKRAPCLTATWLMAAGRRRQSSPPSRPTRRAGSLRKWAASRSSSPPIRTAGRTRSSCSRPPRFRRGSPAGEILFSLITLTAIYGVLLVVETGLIVKYIRGGVPAAMPELLHREPPATNKRKPTMSSPLRTNTCPEPSPGLWV